MRVYNGKPLRILNLTLETNATTFEHHAGGEPCKFADSPSRFLNLYGRLYGPCIDFAADKNTVHSAACTAVYRVLNLVSVTLFVYIVYTIVAQVQIG
jgi:hypothetical protein